MLNFARVLLWSGNLCLIVNWYTSLQAAHILLDNRPDCLVILRDNRRGNPVEVFNKKLIKVKPLSKKKRKRNMCPQMAQQKRCVGFINQFKGEMVQDQRR